MAMTALVVRDFFLTVMVTAAVVSVGVPVLARSVVVMLPLVVVTAAVMVLPVSIPRMLAVAATSVGTAAVEPFVVSVAVIAVMVPVVVSRVLAVAAASVGTAAMNSIVISVTVTAPVMVMVVVVFTVIAVHTSVITTGTARLSPAVVAVFQHPLRKLARVVARHKIQWQRGWEIPSQPHAVAAVLWPLILLTHLLQHLWRRRRRRRWERQRIDRGPRPRPAGGCHLTAP